MTKNSDFNLMVVGGGPGGYVAAIRAAQLGFKVALVEKEQLGGVCLNWGCIPTKALLHGAEIAAKIKEASHFGFDVDLKSFDLSKLVKHSRDVSNRLSRGVDYLMKKNQITVINGTARLVNKCELEVEHSEGNLTTYHVPHIILATGARARTLNNMELDGHHFLGVREAMTPKVIPEKLLVVGAGAIGMEFASFYADIGSDVDIVEMGDRLLPNEDKDISDAILKAYKKRRISSYLSAHIEETTIVDEQVKVSIVESSGNTVDKEYNKVIVAAGIIGNIENLGLEKVGAATKNNFIVTENFGQTNVAGLYAIGDVAGGPCLAHKASHEAVLCVENIAGMSLEAVAHTRIPACTYCRPQVASVGLSEQNARAKGYNLKVGHFNLQANGKALAIGDSEGFVKTIFDEDTGELLGAHMIGPEVTEQIQGFSLAKTLEVTEEELMATVFPHPSISEAMFESVLSAYDKAIHI